jgi:hypothetical protein
MRRFWGHRLKKDERVLGSSDQEGWEGFGVIGSRRMRGFWGHRIKKDEMGETRLLEK